MPGLTQEHRWRICRNIVVTLGGAFALLASVQIKVAAQEQDPDPLFLRYCATCHGVDARGVEGLGVNLVESSYVASSSSAELVEFLRAGRLPNDPASITRLPMPGFAHLEALLPILESVEDWSVAELERVVGAYAESRADGKLGKVAQPLRIAVSGGTVSPAIFETLAILGRDSVLNRVRRCLDARDDISRID